MKRIQGWSGLNWLGGILIIVSWHIHFNKRTSWQFLMLICSACGRNIETLLVLTAIV